MSLKKKYPLLLMILFLPLVALLSHFRMEGFSCDKILSPFAYDPLWETSPLSEEKRQEVLSILGQKFTYLGAGRQCFVFVSEDGKYVLKFLNHERFFVPAWVKRIPLPDSLETFRRGKIERRHARIEAFFTSFHIGYHRLKEESGMVYLQLNRSHTFSQKVKVVDPIGYTHSVDLNETEFILQKRAEGIYPTLKVCANEEIAWKKTLNSYLDLLENRAKKGIVDDDLNMDNIGFLGDKAVLIDTGRLFLDPSLKRPDRFADELQKSSKFLMKKLREEFPDMASYLQEEIQKKIESYRGEFFHDS